MITDNPSLANMYFAPTSGVGTYRMRKIDGSFINFSIRAGGGTELVSRNGWFGRIDGEEVLICNTPAEGEKKIEMVFKDGVLAKVDSGGTSEDVAFTHPIHYQGLRPPDVWSAMAAAPERPSIWQNDGRLKLWYKSPHQFGATLVPLMLFTVWALLRVKTRILFKCILSLMVAVEAAMAILAKSRSSLIAAVVSLGILLFFEFRGKMRIDRRKTIFAAAIFALAVAMAGVLIVRRTAGTPGVKASDGHRIELLAGGLAMLRDAPGGWGSPVATGRAFSTWYASPKARALGVQANLVNDHFTSFVALGWAKGSFYAFLWIFPFVLAIDFARRGGSALPAALLASVNIACFFNVVLGVWSVWIAPLSAIALLMYGLWRSGGAVSALTKSALLSVLAVAVMDGALAVATRYAPKTNPPVQMQGRMLKVGDGDATAIVVDDGQVLGGITMKDEIRAAYKQNPELPAIGMIDDVTAIPEGFNGHLVLAGKSGGDFVARFKSSTIWRLPAAITFISPSIPPSGIPAEITGSSRVLYVMGDLTARYFPEMDNAPKWCVRIKGAEQYIPGWLGYLYVNK